MSHQLDISEFREQYCKSREFPDVKLKVSGLHCQNCVIKLESLTQTSPDVKSLRVNLEQGLVSLSLTHQLARFEPIITQIEKLGFSVEPIPFHGQTQETSQKEINQKLFELIIALFCTGNIMMVSFPVYFDASSEFRGFLSWIAFGLFLPILFYSAREMQKGVIRNFRNLQLDVDTPIILSVWVGLALSTINLVNGKDEIYFDSMGMILSLVLLSRFILGRIISKQSLDSDYADILGLSEVGLETKTGQTKKIPAKNLNPGDIYRLLEGDIVPTDSKLLNNECRLGVDFISGESNPVSVYEGDTVKAGSIIHDQAVRLESSVHLEDSFLFSQLKEASALKKSKIQTLYDEMGSHFSWIIICLALGNLIYWFFFGDFGEGLNRTIALAILACPCALAIGAPLVYKHSISKLIKNSIIVLNSDIFENLTKIDSVLFDKTGTLTKGSLKVSRLIGSLPDPQEVSVIRALEAPSFHPISQAILNFFSTKMPTEVINIENWREIPGEGVFCTYKGKEYSFRKCHDTYRPSFYVDGFKIFELETEEEPREGLDDAIQYFDKLGVPIKVVTGDSESNALQFSQSLPSNIQWHSQLKPKDKMEYNSSRSLFVGDGLNDSFLFQSAFVSGKMRTRVNRIHQNVDFIICSDRMDSLVTLYQSSLRAMRTLKWTQYFSISYNVIGIGFALLGYISPFIAALLMPASSLVVIFISYYGTGGKL